MKILFLLFPLILLLVQGAAGTSGECKRKGGYCTYGRCNYPARSIGRCTLYSVHWG
uniref:Beta-defensin-like domain-containing protein n=1 Tax=Malurus cyaneus samueli TaxID=2593467 RepID=A0A8C5TPL1_9PASS